MKDLGTLALGVCLLAMGLGLLWPWIERYGLDKYGLGRMPGDMMIDHGDIHFRLPLGTAALVATLFALPLLVWKHVLN